MSSSAQQAALCDDRGLAHRNAGRSQEAIAEFTRAIEIEPDYAPPWYHRGWEYQHLGQPEKACSDVDKAVALDPLDYQAWSLRGEVYAEQHKYEQAIDSYAHVAELLPNLAWPLISRAQCLFKVGRGAEADLDLAAAIARIEHDLRQLANEVGEAAKSSLAAGDDSGRQASRPGQSCRAGGEGHAARADQSEHVENTGHRPLPRGPV